jgi:hypothetical protein
MYKEIKVKLLHPRCTPDHIGMIPYWLDESNPAPAREQLDHHYRHGGGWEPFDGFTLLDNNSIKYPGDPAHSPIAEMHLRDETILMYEFSWVLILQKDRTFEICRMD